MSRSRIVGKQVDNLNKFVLIHLSLANNQNKPHLLAPIDIQSIKAAGVTFVLSMLERVIEEQAKGKFPLFQEINCCR